MHKPVDIISELDPSFLAQQLEATDAFATENVRKGYGGPFGAALHIIDLDTGKAIQIGSLAANAVLKTGIASQHAEAEVLSPDNQRALREQLTTLRSQNRTNLAVICTSSGQSCPACQAKQEIVARDLAIDGLLEKGRFVVTYGATFEDTAQIAGFNDAPYVLDNLLRLLGTNEKTMVKVQHRHVDDLPSDIKKRFIIAQADGRKIAFLDGANVAVTGKDNRGHDLFATASVEAIRNACRAQTKLVNDNKPLEQPWLLGNRPEHPAKEAVLYTIQKNVGPLLLAEAQWAGVARIVCVEGIPHDLDADRETPDVSNNAFTHACWSGYNRDESYLTVLRLVPFENNAQFAWREKLMREGSAILYNGLAGSDNLLKMAGEMRKRFEGILMHGDRPALQRDTTAKPVAKL